jgi:glucosamine 6-phosphate synthetase-like amidotransferase/phosphosugar isomerase protein
MIKEFFIKQAIKHGAKNLPKDQQDALVAAVEKNPELFNKIAKEVEELKKKGKPEMYAMLDVMKKYQKELQVLFQK